VVFADDHGEGDSQPPAYLALLNHKSCKACRANNDTPPLWTALYVPQAPSATATRHQNLPGAAGGTFALYSLLCRYAHITPANSGAPDESDMKLVQYSSSRRASDNTAQPTWRARIGARLRNGLHTSAWAQVWVCGVVENTVSGYVLKD
jgi:hypothetical protein